MVRFLHTADLQLGMPLEWVPDDRGALLRERRLEAIDRLIAAAVDGNADFILIAGDLFDANTLEDRVIVQACCRLAKTDLPILAIPGNHDHGGPASIYARESFTASRPENLSILDDPRPEPILDDRVLILPAPLMHRSAGGDPTRHMTSELGRDVAPDAIRIGLAHGSIVGFGHSEADSIDPERARKAELDYLALGDWHGMKKIDERTWYSGTPEPTSFKDNEPGYGLLVEITSHGSSPSTQPKLIGQTRWLRHQAELHGPADIDRLESWFEEIDSPLHVLVRLQLEGVLGLEDQERVEKLCSHWDHRLIHLRLRGPGIATHASDRELDIVASDGYVRAAVERLRDLSDKRSTRSKQAADALRLLYRLKVRQGGEGC
ncbi:MAG: exonuclease SbcCD subunit D [Planctomycetota bacterium]